MDYFNSNGSRSSSYGGSPNINDDDDDEYPEDYVPLSNLPTPPLSSTAYTPPENEFTEVDPEVLGTYPSEHASAKHLHQADPITPLDSSCNPSL